jgi:nicotinamide mononucleotide transporter
VESWWVWIGADIVYIPLYAYKDLYLTSLLYAGFLALCLVGLAGWRRDLAGRVPAGAAGAQAVP